MERNQHFVFLVIALFAIGAFYVSSLDDKGYSFTGYAVSDDNSPLCDEFMVPYTADEQTGFGQAGVVYKDKKYLNKLAEDNKCRVYTCDASEEKYVSQKVPKNQCLKTKLASTNKVYYIYPNPVQTCEPTDTGVMVGGDMLYQNHCSNNMLDLTYYTCEGSQAQENVMPCSAGCIEMENSPATCAETICIDSDGGKEPTVPGETSYQGDTQVDSCVSETTVLEYFCKTTSGVMTIASKEMECGFGKVCRDGACVDPSAYYESALHCTRVKKTGLAPVTATCPDGTIAVGAGYVDPSGKDSGIDKLSYAEDLSGVTCSGDGGTISCEAVCCKIGPNTSG